MSGYCIHETLFDDVPWRKDVIDEDVRFVDGLMYPSDQLGLGIELNMGHGELTDPAKRETVLRPYFIAKEQGCRFYLGSDAHHPSDLDGAMTRFSLMVDALDLTENDKFHIGQ